MAQAGHKLAGPSGVLQRRAWGEPHEAQPSRVAAADDVPVLVSLRGVPAWSGMSSRYPGGSGRTATRQGAYGPRCRRAGARRVGQVGSGSIRRVMVAAVLVLVGGLAGCGWWQSDDGDDAISFEVVRSPEFVNRLIPGERPLALVEVRGDAQPGPVELVATSSLDGMTVRVGPSSIAVGGVAEVWVEVPEVDQDVPFTVTVVASRGAEEVSLAIDATAVPGVDDVADTAGQIVQVFLDTMATEVPGLPATADDLMGGTPVAGLLVVTHYVWFTPEYEVGLAWHIMVAPDDFAELYVRPRTVLAPTRAFRIGSWSTALAGGPVDVREIDPPAEVTR